MEALIGFSLEANSMLSDRAQKTLERWLCRVRDVEARDVCEDRHDVSVDDKQLLVRLRLLQHWAQLEESSCGFGGGLSVDTFERSIVADLDA